MNNGIGEAAAGHDPYSALRLRDFRLYLAGNFMAVLGMQMQGVAVGWEIYERTGSKLALGLVGLVQFVPVLSLALVSGQVADRFDRRRVVIASMSLIALAALGLAWISAHRGDVRLMFGCLFLNGVARAFQQPAKASLLPQIVSPGAFANAVTWSTGSFHLASVLGPAFGGLLIAYRGPTAVYLLDAAAAIGFVLALTQARVRAAVPSSGAVTVRELSAGFAFVWRSPVILGAITLDMFAVLLGGATTLLPVFAEDILAVGPRGLGWMRTAPALGALAMSLLMAHRPPLDRAGKALLWSVAGFGVATVVFGLSGSYWLSLAMLFLTGAFDNISVVVRHTLVQLLTPDPLRGRVSAVNSMFIGASNELGGFESGMVAWLFGPIISVVGGGVGTLVVVAVVAWLCPPIRRYGILGSEPAAR